METIIKKKGIYRYVEEGEGPVIILLHGLFGALSNWKEVVEKFSGKYKVVIPLMPIYDMPLLLTNVSSLSLYIGRFIKFMHYRNFTLRNNYFKHSFCLQAIVTSNGRSERHHGCAAHIFQSLA